MMAAETENAQPSPPLAKGMGELAIITLPTNIQNRKNQNKHNNIIFSCSVLVKVSEIGV